MVCDYFLHLLPNGKHRIQAGCRVLEDHRDVAAADLAEGLAGERKDVDVVQEDAAAGDAAGVGKEVERA